MYAQAALERALELNEHLWRSHDFEKRARFLANTIREGEFIPDYATVVAPSQAQCFQALTIGAWPWWMAIKCTFTKRMAWVVC
jgi:hypothetical protein